MVHVSRAQAKSLCEGGLHAHDRFDGMTVNEEAARAIRDIKKITSRSLHKAGISKNKANIAATDESQTAKAATSVYKISRITTLMIFLTMLLTMDLLFLNEGDFKCDLHYKISARGVSRNANDF
ncbi:hypothetical protein F444_06279 [Phytophthora nicotianae P1976]|nr:hypothetical protein F444_06279 [Phytophthora nicotianae P1976]